MDFTALLSKLEHLGPWGYGVILLISFLESLPALGTVIPGATFTVFAGILAAEGYFNLSELIGVAALGAILGDTLSYFLGTKGTHLFRAENKLLKLSHLERGQAFFVKHGSKSILLGRFMGPIRAVVPFVAGLSGMERKKFLAWDIVSGLAWAISYILLGYFFGGAFQVIEAWFSRVGVLLLVLFLIAVLIWFLAKKSGVLWGYAKSVVLSFNVQRLMKRYPLVFAQVRQRLDQRHFNGLPLTVLTLMFIYVASLFVGVVEDILTSDPIVEVDLRLAGSLALFRDTGLIHFFTWVTLLGSLQVVGGFILASSVLLFLWKRKNFITPLFVTVCSAGIFNYFGKLTFQRPRPEGAYYLESSFSFPSGHSTIVVAFYGFLAYVLFRCIKKWGGKVNAIAGCVLIMLLVGFSRLYLGVHYLSDVWGGYLVGALCLIFGITFSEWMLSREPVPGSAPQKRPYVGLVTTGILVFALGFYALIGLRYTPELNDNGGVQASIEVSNSDAVLDLFTSKLLPQTTESVFGDSQEPLNFIIIAKTDEQVLSALNGAGFETADEVSLSSLLKLAWTKTFDSSYSNAPLTPLFWNASAHLFGFEENGHEIRLWKTSIVTDDGQMVYTATANNDESPDLDAEREYVYSTLEETGLEMKAEKLDFVGPFSGETFKETPFFTDGSLYLIVLE